MTTQLCWRCNRATGGCSWSHNGTPVKGWKAQKTQVKGFDKNIDSYLVTECPLFVEEPERKIKIEHGYMMPGQFIKAKEFAKLIDVKHNKLRLLSNDELMKSASKIGIKIRISGIKNSRRIYIEEQENVRT